MSAVPISTPGRLNPEGIPPQPMHLGTLGNRKAAHKSAPVLNWPPPARWHLLFADLGGQLLALMSVRSDESLWNAGSLA
jgi:hypothetical protein